ncbi:MAG: hypothetical protein JXA42_11040 [Anaerolineales bacterium]|nr:hypothetical protein [Anaerolineales bacterium]
MEFEEVGKPRYIKSELAAGINIRIPREIELFNMLFTGFWLLGWSIGELIVIAIFIGELVNKVTVMTNDFPVLHLVLFLGVWSFSGIFLLIEWQWHIKGFEVIKIYGDSLILEQQSYFYKRSKQFRLEKVELLRVTNPKKDIWSMLSGLGMLGKTERTRAFDYGAKTIRFGIGLDEAEAKMILDDIQQEYPDLVARGNI